MWHSLFHPSISVLELVVRAVLVYLFILVLLRISGKRELGQLSAIELVSILLISNAVQNSMNGGDNSLAGGFILAAVLIIMSTVIGMLSYRFTPFRHLIEGAPTILVHNGRPIEKNLRKELISREELSIMLRKQGVDDVKTVKYAILESGGTLTITHCEGADPLHEEKIEKDALPKTPK